jgi:hypothetical protein
MADFADIGSDYTERWLEAQLSEHAYQLNHATSAFEIGRCRNCEEKLDDGRNYCDEACRNDHQLRIASDKRNGKHRGF